MYLDLDHQHELAPRRAAAAAYRLERRETVRAPLSSSSSRLVLFILLERSAQHGYLFAVRGANLPSVFV